jgi:hypothetical protein
LAVGLLITPTLVMGQQTSIGGLNTQNIRNVIDNQVKLMDEATLHNQSDLANNLDNGLELLNCIRDLLNLNANPYGFNTTSTCDVIIKDQLTTPLLYRGVPTDSHYGNNQTMINLAHAYLKARGIQ